MQFLMWPQRLLPSILLLLVKVGAGVEGVEGVCVCLTLAATNWQAKVMNHTWNSNIIPYQLLRVSYLT